MIRTEFYRPFPLSETPFLDTTYPWIMPVIKLSERECSVVQASLVSSIPSASFYASRQRWSCNPGIFVPVRLSVSWRSREAGCTTVPCDNFSKWENLGRTALKVKKERCNLPADCSCEFSTTVLTSQPPNTPPPISPPRSVLIDSSTNMHLTPASVRNSSALQLVSQIPTIKPSRTWEEAVRGRFRGEKCLISKLLCSYTM